MKNKGNNNNKPGLEDFRYVGVRFVSIPSSGAVMVGDRNFHIFRKSFQDFLGKNVGTFIEGEVGLSFVYNFFSKPPPAPAVTRVGTEQA